MLCVKRFTFSPKLNELMIHFITRRCQLCVYIYLYTNLFDPFYPISKHEDQTELELKGKRWLAIQDKPWEIPTMNVLNNPNTGNYPNIGNYPSFGNAVIFVSHHNCCCCWCCMRNSYEPYLAVHTWAIHPWWKVRKVNIHCDTSQKSTVMSPSAWESQQ